jgi:hypothetical protein
MERWTSVEAKDSFISCGEIGYEGREGIAERVFGKREGVGRIELAGWDKRAGEQGGMNFASDNCSMSDVDWHHGFLDGNVENDLRRFGWNS